MGLHVGYVSSGACGVIDMGAVDENEEQVGTCGFPFCEGCGHMKSSHFLVQGREAPSATGGRPPCSSPASRQEGQQGGGWKQVGTCLFSLSSGSVLFSIPVEERTSKKNKIEKRKETGYQKSKGNDVFKASVSSPGVVSSEGKRRPESASTKSSYSI